MAGTIVKKPLAGTDFAAPVNKKRFSSNGNGMSKISTAIVGFLAASQSFGTAAARPVGGLNGLAAPVAQSSTSNVRELLANKPLLDRAVAPAPALGKDLTIIAEAPAPGSSNALGESEARPMQTWIVNKSDVDLVVTTAYNCFVGCSSNSTFINHSIPKFTEDVDQYCQQHQFFDAAISSSTSESNPLKLHCPPSITLSLGWATEKKSAGTIMLEPDHSVIVANMGNGLGLNVYQSIYGDLSTPNGPPLRQIYSNSTKET